MDTHFALVKVDDKTEPKRKPEPGCTLMALVLFALLCHTPNKQNQVVRVQPQGLVLVLLLEPKPHDEC